jgi:RNA polymerase sigma-70 factor, ECF subfamily
VIRQFRQPTLSPGAPEADAEDAALVALVIAGDQDALAALYRRHGAASYRLAYRVTASVTLAEDAVQEAFVGLWRASASYAGRRGSVRSWLLALTHHKAVDLVRREIAEKRRQDAEAAELAIGTASVADPAAVACGKVEAGLVRAALLELPAEQREALTLAYFGGYTQSQIAELIGVPLGTVKTRTFQAMRRLRRILALADSVLDEGWR